MSFFASFAIYGDTAFVYDDDLTSTDNDEVFSDGRKWRKDLSDAVAAAFVVFGLLLVVCLAWPWLGFSLYREPGRINHRLSPPGLRHDIYTCFLLGVYAMILASLPHVVPEIWRRLTGRRG